MLRYYIGLLRLYSPDLQVSSHIYTYAAVAAPIPVLGPQFGRGEACICCLRVCRAYAFSH